MSRQKRVSLFCDKIMYICPIEAWTNDWNSVKSKCFNNAGSAQLQCMSIVQPQDSWAFNWRSSPFSHFLLQIDTFGKWLRCLTYVCYVNLQKLRFLEKNSDNLSRLGPLPPWISLRPKFMITNIQSYLQECLMPGHFAHFIFLVCLTNELRCLKCFLHSSQSQPTPRLWVPSRCFFMLQRWLEE